MAKMHNATCLLLIALLLAPTFARFSEPTACEDEACSCDSFTRLTCRCSEEYEELTLRRDGAYRVPSTVIAIKVEGCKRVTFLSEAIRDLIQLRTIELRNVGYAVINERALAWSPFSSDNELGPGIRIRIINSTVNEISSYAIQGHINEILITDSKMVTLKPYAFSSLTGVKRIELINNVFTDVEIQTFKKFTTENFIVRGGEARTLPSRFLSDVEVTNLFRIEGVTIDILSSLTFLVSLPKRVLIESNTIRVLGGDSFHITAKGPVTFRNNTVTTVRKGAFMGLTVDREVLSVLGRQELLIDNNTVTDMMPTSLLYNSTTLSLRVDGLNLNKKCTCELDTEWSEVLNNQGGIISCWYDEDGHYISVPTFVDSRCGFFKQTYWIYIVVAVVLTILLAGLVIFFVVRRERLEKKKIRVVLPDGKTYRETEFHVIVERAELLTTDL